MNADKRREAAERFRPGAVDCLLVAEAPPSDESRYFYFEDVPTSDSLYLELSKAYFLSLDVRQLRSAKAHFLDRMRSLGIWLIDLSREPLSKSNDKAWHLGDCVSSLVDRCRTIKPRRVVLLANSVYDVAYKKLVEAEVPVVDVRIPFPGSGRQKEFRAAFWKAMRAANLSADPVVLDGNCISYWLDALDDVAAPHTDDPLAAQKSSLVRMFYFWPWVLSYTPGIRTEVEQIKDPERLKRHEQWMNTHLRELHGPNEGTAAALREHLAERGVNANDANWIAEAMALNVPVVITWDQDLLDEASNLEGVQVLSPEVAWDRLSVPARTPPAIEPTPGNPLSEQDWWRV